MTAGRLFLDAEETATVLRCSTSHVYRLCKSGDLEHRRVGHRLLVPTRVVYEMAGLPVPQVEVAS
ncbi:MAG TPA: helix-turn-helix domain-containing protein [Nocardioides sp.]